jgi:hypothetical protein
MISFDGLHRLGAGVVPVVAGLVGAALLVGLYLGLVTWAQDWTHARDLLWDDRYFVSAIAAGFGTQIGLYIYLRQAVRRRQMAAPGVVTAVGAGTSSAAMIACCAHHLADVLPLVGLSGLAVFLGDYRLPLMILGIGVNAIGVAVMLRLVVRERRFLALAKAPLAERLKT